MAAAAAAAAGFLEKCNALSVPYLIDKQP